ncbi:hypothetical protein [Aliivibrio fischeri]|uniref:hypothetical protein n=1 Tax=Aliivibrio fischeri TaxID=668 RepID=UPI0007C45B2D|nr:hypothetical protein [Aliivibrio fischeri]
MNSKNLIPGKSYLCSKPSVSLQDPGGNKIILNEKCYRITVLEKPKRVTAECAGFDRQEIDLPAHLSTPEWAFVLNLSTNEQHWLNTLDLQVKEL